MFLAVKVGINLLKTSATSLNPEEIYKCKFENSPDAIDKIELIANGGKTEWESKDAEKTMVVEC